MNHYTTLAEIRKHKPCKDGLAKLLAALGEDYGEETPITYDQILESNGVQDATWALRADLSPDSDKAARLFACDCAEHVLHIYEAKYPGDLRPRQSIEVAKRFAVGEATEYELAAACDAACDAARAAARDAAWAAASAAWDAARDAARDAAWDSAWAAARAAARYAAWAAACDADLAAARAAARDAAWAAMNAERAWQAAKFVEYFCN